MPLTLHIAQIFAVFYISPHLYLFGVWWNVVAFGAVVTFEKKNHEFLQQFSPQIVRGCRSSCTKSIKTHTLDQKVLPYSHPKTCLKCEWLIIFGSLTCSEVITVSQEPSSSSVSSVKLCLFPCLDFTKAFLPSTAIRLPSFVTVLARVSPGDEPIEQAVSESAS